MNNKNNFTSFGVNVQYAAHRIVIRTALIALLLCFCLSARAQSALKVHGAVLVKGLLDPHVEEITAKSSIKFDAVGNGADNGLLDLVQGRADVAMISASLENLAKKLNSKNPGTVDTSKLTTIPLGFSKFVLIVNTNNPVRRITDQQAVGLLSGKITSWKEVGGPDLAVLVIAPPKSGGVYTAIETILLKSEKFSPDLKEVINPRQVQVAVSQNERACGPLPVSVLNNKVAVLTIDTQIVMPMALVVRGEPSIEAQKLAEAIKPFIQ